MSKQSDELVAQVAEDLASRIEAGGLSWSMPWREMAEAGMPRSIDGRPYRGFNLWDLSMAAAHRGYASQTWGTYKAWGRHGAQVRKGESGTHVLLWKRSQYVKRNADTGEDEQREGLLVRVFSVFNADQVDGYEAPPVEEMTGPEADAAAEAYWAAVPADVAYGGNAAYYTPGADRIQLPKREAFKSAEGYYGTVAHEHAHWTGHESRLNRDLTHRFGTEGYAWEELVAELTAATWCGIHGQTTADRMEDHAAYLASWIRGLRETPKVLVTVTSKAQAALDHLDSYQVAAQAAEAA